MKGEEIAYRLRLLQQNMVVFTELNAKDDAGVNLEAIDPLFPLQALSAEVEYTVVAKKSAGLPFHYILVITASNDFIKVVDIN